jgi:predicted Ser/Thr protein kinase
MAGFKDLADILYQHYGVGASRASSACVSWAKDRLAQQIGWQLAEKQVSALNRWRAKKGYPLAYV